MAAVDLNAVVERYIAIRDEKAQAEAAHKKVIKRYDDALETIETFLKGQLDSSNAKNMRTDAGTFFKDKKESVTVASKETYLDWIKRTNEWDLLDVRAAKLNILKWKDANGDLPPGLNYVAFDTVQVRRN